MEDHLRGKPAGGVALYERFVELVEVCGPSTCAVAETTITFRGSRRGFAGARPTTHGPAGHLDLQRMVEDPRILRATPYTKRLFVHQFRVGDRGRWTTRSPGGSARPMRVGQGGTWLGHEGGDRVAG